MAAGAKPSDSDDWRCPVCDGTGSKPRFRSSSSPARVNPGSDAFRPSSERFGETSGELVRCLACGHTSLRRPPGNEDLMEAYHGAADDVSLREEDGQVETARRALRRIEEHVAPGHVVDLGSWTGSFLVAAKERGWEPLGVEPSSWAAGRAHERGIEVIGADLFAAGIKAGSCRLVVLGDVLEHLVDPRAAIEIIRDMLEPGGALYLTIPNAGSRLARAMGQRWWSVLPMHLQYFTPATLRRTLESGGLDVVDMRTHAKAFSARYYAERLGGYSGILERAAVGLVEVTRLAERMVAPDFRDRLSAIALRR